MKNKKRNIVMISGTLKNGSPFSFPMVVQGDETPERLEYLARNVTMNAFLSAPVTLKFHFPDGEQSND